jgi:DNA adenine methylase
MNIDTKIFDWIGGKKWLSVTLNQKFDKILSNNRHITNYVEPFCGSLGSVIGSIDTFKKHKIQRIILNDINTNLINVYNCVKNTPNKLFTYLSNIEIEHINLIPEKAFDLNKTKDKEQIKYLMKDANNYYLNIRNQFNTLKDSKELDDIIISSAQFIFIMWRAFNGLYRENSSGKNNSPYGWNNNKINLENRQRTIMEFHYFFNDMNVEFYNLNYDQFIENFGNLSQETLFYFDPPYLNKNIKENSYSKEGFNLDNQIKLLNYVNNLDYIVYSNHYLDLFSDFFYQDKYEINKVFRKNIISSDNNSRINDAAEILTYTKTI